MGEGTLIIYFLIIQVDKESIKLLNFILPLIRSRNVTRDYCIITIIVIDLIHVDKYNIYSPFICKMESEEKR